MTRNTVSAQRFLASGVFSAFRNPGCLVTSRKSSHSSRVGTFVLGPESNPAAASRTRTDGPRPTFPSWVPFFHFLRSERNSDIKRWRNDKYLCKCIYFAISFRREL